MAKILVATFLETNGLLRAVRKARSQMFRVYDVFAPFPVHGLDEAMGIRRTRLPWVTLIIALTDHLQWPTLPGLAYQFGTAGSIECATRRIASKASVTRPTQRPKTSSSW